MTEQLWKVLPDAFLVRIRQIIPQHQLAVTLDSFSKEKQLSLRVNTLKTSVDSLKIELQKQNILFDQVVWYPEAIVVDKKTDKSTITASDLPKNGLLYIQSLSSMIPALILNPQPGEKICDLTAAPGSKTSQIAAMMHNEGEIVANDKSRERLYKLRAVLAAQGVTNTQVTQLPGEDLWKRYPEYFDKTLVDVPCTMEGRFLCSDPKSYKDWTPKKVKVLSQLQKYILRSAVSATKPGGLIVYSTCTLEPEENEGVVDWVLKREKGAVSVEAVSLDVPNRQNGLTEWQKKSFDPQLAETMRIVPSETMEGFYVAALRKHTSTVSGDFA